MFAFKIYIDALLLKALSFQKKSNLRNWESPSGFLGDKNKRSANNCNSEDINFQFL